MRGEDFVCPGCHRLIAFDQRMDPDNLDGVEVKHEVCGWEAGYRHWQFDEPIGLKNIAVSVRV